jgi:hypothetical protein
MCPTKPVSRNGYGSPERAGHSIYVLLAGKGYVRKFEKLSKFDDWYVYEA